MRDKKNGDLYDLAILKKKINNVEILIKDGDDSEQSKAYLKRLRNEMGSLIRFYERRWEEEYKG